MPHVGNWPGSQQRVNLCGLFVMHNVMIQQSGLSIKVFPVQDMPTGVEEDNMLALPFQQIQYLKHLAQSNPSMDHFICQVFNEGTLVARAYLQSMPFQGDRLDNFRPKIFFTRIIYNAFVRPIRWRIVSLGSIFTTGDNGLVFSDNLSQENRATIYHFLLRHVREGLIPYDGLLVKDIYVERDSWMKNSLTDLGFQLTPSEPDMILDHLQRFASPEEYKSSLRAKYRTKFNQIVERSTSLQVDDYQKWHEAPRDLMYPLYVNIMSSVDFYIQLVSPSYLTMDIPSGTVRPRLRTYSMHGEVIGWISWFEDEQRIHAHLIGLNHKLAAPYKVYQRILYDLVLEGIRLKKDKVCFGRTSQQAKSNVGARPIGMVSAVYHKNFLVRSLLRRLIGSIALDTEVIRHAFREKNG